MWQLYNRTKFSVFSVNVEIAEEEDRKEKGSYKATDGVFERGKYNDCYLRILHNV
jgi:hypothetical protein